MSFVFQHAIQRIVLGAKHIIVSQTFIPLSPYFISSSDNILKDIKISIFTSEK